MFIENCTKLQYSKMHTFTAHTVYMCTVNLLKGQ